MRDVIEGSGRYFPKQNFFVEGVSSDITTKNQLLSEMLNSTVNQRIVKSFEINGSDIYFHCHTNFAQAQLKWHTTGLKANMTGFYDIGGHISTIAQGVFDLCVNLERLWIPNCSTIQGPSGFSTMRQIGLIGHVIFPNVTSTKNHVCNDSTGIERLDLPALTFLDIQTAVVRVAWDGLTGLDRLDMPLLDTVTYRNGTEIRHFRDVKSGCVVYVDPALETSDGGSREKLIVYLEDTRSCDIRYIANTTVPGTVTDLSDSNITSSGVDLSFTVPSATNTIDFYEVWIDDGTTRWHPLMSHQEIVTTGGSVTGLDSGVTYDIKVKTIDEWYNKSAFSNTIQITTL